jgi:broad specificity phosphatase PhoE
MKLLLVRHAETESNVGNVLQGHLDIPLTNRGLQQAERLAKRLQERHIDAVYSSDLLRARQTTEIIIGKRPLTVSYDVNLRERHYGEFQGRPVSELDKAFRASGLLRESFRPDGGENYHDVEIRVTAFLDSILKEHNDLTVLVVGHSGTNRIILRRLLQRPFAELLDFEQENTCINELNIKTDFTVETVMLNCLQHLQGLQYVQLGAQE